jgi:hypothetical protein
MTDRVCASLSMGTTMRREVQLKRFESCDSRVQSLTRLASGPPDSYWCQISALTTGKYGMTSGVVPNRASEDYCGCMKLMFNKAEP